MKNGALPQYCHALFLRGGTVFLDFTPNYCRAENRTVIADTVNIPKEKMVLIRVTASVRLLVMVVRVRSICSKVAFS